MELKLLDAFYCKYFTFETEGIFVEFIYSYSF